MLFKKTPPDKPTGIKESGTIRDECAILNRIGTRGELGDAISLIILRCSPRDLQQMKRNFGIRIRDITPEYRDQLEKKIAEHLIGTWQTIRLMKQQGVFATMHEPLTEQQKEFWNMVIVQCESAGTGEGAGLRFLKFLLAGFCMFVLREPGHAVGTPFPGGDKVECIAGVYYCPVREKADDVQAALCPFCPALQTPEIGYLRPPLNASEHRKQEYIEHCHKFHNFNG
ncbi:MAG TPA: DUF2115 domain-containing protein [Methanoregula sp.]|nr:DUF2115 domain-containing protein [Methanoregula sp.]